MTLVVGFLAAFTAILGAAYLYLFVYKPYFLTFKNLPGKSRVAACSRDLVFAGSNCDDRG